MRAGPSALDAWFEATSVLPLAAFALFHVGTYAGVLLGVRELGGPASPSPLVLATEAALVWLPLAFHVAVAPGVWARRRREPAKDPSDRAWRALHGLSGLALGAFLADHFVRFRLPILRGERYPSEALESLAGELSRTTFGVPLVAGLSVVGTLALGFHLGFGLWRISERRPRLAAARATRGACVGIGVTTALVGVLCVVRLAAG